MEYFSNHASELKKFTSNIYTEENPNMCIYFKHYDPTCIVYKVTLAEMPLRDK